MDGDTWTQIQWKKIAWMQQATGLKPWYKVATGAAKPTPSSPVVGTPNGGLLQYVMTVITASDRQHQSGEGSGSARRSLGSGVRGLQQATGLKPWYKVATGAAKPTPSPPVVALHRMFMTVDTASDRVLPIWRELRKCQTLVWIRCSTPAAGHVTEWGSRPGTRLPQVLQSPLPRRLW